MREQVSALTMKQQCPTWERPKWDPQFELLIPIFSQHRRWQAQLKWLGSRHSGVRPGLGCSSQLQPQSSPNGWGHLWSEPTAICGVNQHMGTIFTQVHQPPASQKLQKPERSYVIWRLKAPKVKKHLVKINCRIGNVTHERSDYWSASTPWDLVDLY